MPGHACQSTSLLHLECYDSLSGRMPVVLLEATFVATVVSCRCRVRDFGDGRLVLRVAVRAKEKTPYKKQHRQDNDAQSTYRNSLRGENLSCLRLR